MLELAFTTQKMQECSLVLGSPLDSSGNSQTGTSSDCATRGHTSKTLLSLQKRLQNITATGAYLLLQLMSEHESTPPPPPISEVPRNLLPI